MNSHWVSVFRLIASVTMVPFCQAVFHKWFLTFLVIMFTSLGDCLTALSISLAYYAISWL